MSKQDTSEATLPTSTFACPSCGQPVRGGDRGRCARCGWEHEARRTDYPTIDDAKEAIRGRIESYVAKPGTYAFGHLNGLETALDVLEALGKTSPKRSDG